MSSLGRNLLNKGDVIKLYKSMGDRSSVEEFEIGSVVGEGASMVCYEAIRLSDGHTGKLKEFYPVEAGDPEEPPYHLQERRAGGQLVPSSGNYKAFREKMRAYIDNYSILDAKIQGGKGSDLLRNFMQIGEAYYGAVQDNSWLGKCPTAYTWLSGRTGENFGEYLDKVRQNPSSKSNQRIDEILSVMIALTDCIISLHRDGLYNLDIKPDNFIVLYDSDRKIKPEDISIFDVDSVCDLTSMEKRPKGTPGFGAPELAKGMADNRSDIYSIGALLYYALLIDDDTYKPENYGEIEAMTKESELIASSKADSDEKLASKVIDILKKCLAANPDDRYENGEELKSDLEVAENYTRPHVINEEIQGEGVRYEKVSSESDLNLVMQKLLRDHPLYQCMKHGPGNINILVVGADKYSEKFIDYCLQVGQMKGTTLSITVISDDAEEARAHYLETRPALDHFVSVSGSPEVDADKSYGNLEFTSLTEEKKFEVGEEECNKQIVDEIVDIVFENNGFCNYIFITLGNDELNAQVATLVKESELAEGPICYVSKGYREISYDDEKKMLYPLLVNTEITMDSIDPELERMAFNVHLAYEKTLNIDVAEELRKFKEDEYNYASSVANALSIRYKLFSIGIVFAEDIKDSDEFEGFTIVKNEEEAAREFSKLVLKNPEERDSFNILVALEHRRWVISYVTEGWTTATDLEKCVADGKVKDKEAKTHPCLVFSTEETPLKGEEYLSNNRSKWDIGEIDPSLDELDRMSVELHRFTKQKADEFKDSEPLKEMNEISKLLDESNDYAIYMYKQFEFYLKNILDGSESYTRQYDDYEESFKEAIEGMEESKRNIIYNRLEIIKRQYYHVKESNLYKDYKANDEVLVDKIPYILTYKPQPEMVMAFDDGRLSRGKNEDVFANVASATVLKPSKISYLYCFDQNSTVDLLTRKISSVMNYLHERKVRCDVDFCIAYLTSAREDEASLVDGLDKLGRELKKEARQKNISFDRNVNLDNVIVCENYEEAVGVFTDYISERKISIYDGTTRIFSSAMYNWKVVSAVCATSEDSEQEKIPYFEFDWRRKHFINCVNCEYLKYVKDDSHIKVKDMFALMKAKDTRFNFPELENECEELWGIYTGKYRKIQQFRFGVQNWNRLCDELKEYDDKKPAWIEFNKSYVNTNMVRTYIYDVPDYVYEKVDDILKQLKKNSLVDNRSTLEKELEQGYKLKIYGYKDFDVKYAGLFSDPNELFAKKNISFCPKRGRDCENIICVWYDDLAVENAEIDEYGYEVLLELKKKGYVKGTGFKAVKLINAEKKDGGQIYKVSFTYASSRYKKLLTCAGQILEIYTYYQVLKTGYFDDVVCSYEFTWSDESVKSELDLVLTKGFRTIIVECKGCKKLDQEFYYKLYSVADHFGIGTIRVLLGNTYDKETKNISADNRMQRSRGNELGITTISDEYDIINVGETLKNIMKKEQGEVE